MKTFIISIVIIGLIGLPAFIAIPSKAEKDQLILLTTKNKNQFMKTMNIDYNKTICSEYNRFGGLKCESVLYNKPVSFECNDYNCYWLR